MRHGLRNGRVILGLVLVLFCSHTHQYSVGVMSPWITGQSIDGHTIRTVQVQTKCIMECVADENCFAAVVDCISLQDNGNGVCSLKYQASYTVVLHSSKCYSEIQSRAVVDNTAVGPASTSASFLTTLSSTSVTSQTTQYTPTVSTSVTSQTTQSTPTFSTSVTSQTTSSTPALSTESTTSQSLLSAALTTLQQSLTSTTSSQTTIYAIIGNLNNYCHASSAKDIALLTSAGVNVYDNVADLTTGPCLPAASFSSIFVGYASSRPSVENVICMMVYQDNFIDLFTDNQVWRWQVHSSFLLDQSSQGFPKTIESYFGVSSSQAPPDGSDWCVTRHKGRLDQFFFKDNLLYFYSDQDPYRQTYPPSATDKYHNGFNLNPWTQLPSTTVVAVTSVTTQYDEFVMIGEDNNVYNYLVDHSSNYNDPSISVSLQGALVL